MARNTGFNRGENAVTFTFGNRSEEILALVHPDLQAIARYALELSEVDFAVIHGMRTKEEEAVYVAQGKSQTMKSRHLHGFAIDVAAYVNGSIDWLEAYYHDIGDAFKQAAYELNIPIVWGGDWHTLKDFGHFELAKSSYPDPVENV